MVETADLVSCQCASVGCFLISVSLIIYVCGMCVDSYDYFGYAGTGMGAAAVFERGDSCDELCNAK